MLVPLYGRAISANSMIVLRLARKKCSVARQARLCVWNLHQIYSSEVDRTELTLSPFKEHERR